MAVYDVWCGSYATYPTGGLEDAITPSFAHMYFFSNNALRFLTVCQTVCTVWLVRLLGPVMQRVTSREFQRNFGRFQDEALRAPLSITRNGRERLVLLSVEEYARLKRRDREALFVEELSETEIEAIRRAEPSADAAQYDHELTAADDPTP